MKKYGYLKPFSSECDIFIVICCDIYNTMCAEKQVSDLLILEFTKFILKYFNEESEDTPDLPKEFYCLLNYVGDYVSCLAPNDTDFFRACSYIRVYQSCQLIKINKGLKYLDESIGKGLNLDNDYLNILKIIYHRPLIAFKNLSIYCNCTTKKLNEGLKVLEEEGYILVAKHGVGTKRFFNVSYKGKILLKQGMI